MPKKPKRVVVKKRKRRVSKREKSISEIGLQIYRDKLRERDLLAGARATFGNIAAMGRTFDDMLPPEKTINRIPRPEPL